MDETIKSIGIIVLAAGSASRMNEPKQLLEFQGKSLLRRAVETAIETKCSPVVVVLGANFERTSAEIQDLNVERGYNKEFHKGLSSSLKIGLAKLLEINPNLDAFIVSLADQPFVTANHFRKFIKKFYQTNNPIVAAKYNEIIGVPALFSKKIFSEFGGISGDKGAKILLENHSQTLETIDLPEAAFDIDTKEDYLKLKTQNIQNN